MENDFVIKIIIYGVLICLFVLQIILYLRGVESDWYRSLDITTSYSLGGGVVAWVVVYAFVLIGYTFIAFTVKDAPIDFLIGLTIASLSLTVLWNFVFFYARDILLSVVIQIAVTAIFLWVTFVVFEISVFGGLMQLPVLLRTYFLFYQNVVLYLDNSDKSNLRPLKRRRNGR